MPAFQFFSAWLLMIVFLALLAATSWGKSVVYYTLWLAIALLLVTHVDEIKSLMPAQAFSLNG